MVDKLKGGKARQAVLPEVQEEKDKPDSLDKVVAQAFDSDPKVRLHVAEELGKTQDPRAIFALIELSSDKDESVKIAAQKSLGQYKEEEQETIVSLEKLFAERKEMTKPEGMPEVRQRMMPQLEKLFAHYEPKKRDSVKRKLLPSIEKLFGFHPKTAQGADPLHGLDKITAVQSTPLPTTVQQERQTEHIPAENAPNFPFGQKKEEKPEPKPVQEEYAEETEEISPEMRTLPEKRDSVEVGREDHEFASEQPRHNASQERQAEFEDEAPSPEEQEHESQLAENKYYLLAYKIATTPGMGKAELKREQGRLLSNFKKEIGLAFKMAEERAEQEGMANFSNLKPGMKNLSFAEMAIVSISDTGFGSGAKKKPFAKIRLTDGHKEISALVPHERAIGINQQDRLALKGVAVDFLVESSEVVLVVKNKSRVVVVK